MADQIIIDLEKVFGRAILLSAYQAEKSGTDTLLVMAQTDIPLFLAHLDPLIGELEGAFSTRLEQIQTTETTLTVSLKEDVISTEGLNRIEKALMDGLTSGVLSQYQAGAKGYEGVQAYNRKRFDDALRTINNVSVFRVKPKDKIRITQRTL